MKTISKKNWLESVMKWRNIVSSLEHLGYPSNGGYDCGFCTEFNNEPNVPKGEDINNVTVCGECPLFKMKVCANFGYLPHGRTSTYWKYSRACGSSTKLKYAKQILEAIEGLKP